MPGKRWLTAGLLATAWALSPASGPALCAEEVSTAPITLERIPAELQEIFLKSLSHPDNPLAYSLDSQGVLCDKRVSPCMPISQPQARDLVFQLKGLWLAARGLPAVFAKRSGNDFSMHLYDPDGHVSELGNEIYKRLDKNRDLLDLISLEELAVQVRKTAPSPDGSSSLKPLDDFFDQMRQNADSGVLGSGGATAPLDLSDILPFRLQRLKGRLSREPSRRALEDLMGGSSIPMIPQDISSLLKETGSADASADWREAVRQAIEALPMGQEILKMRMDRLWSLGHTGKGVKIALLELGGFPDTRHPFLRNVSNQPVSGQPENTDGHATMTAGILRSVAPEAEILAYSTQPPQWMKDIAAGLKARTKDASLAERTDDSIQRTFIAGQMEDAYRKGAKVISISIGFRAAENPLGDPIVQKIEKLSKKGVVTVSAAGNDPDQLFNSAAAKMGSSFTAAPSAITVGSSDIEDKIYISSLEGEIYAPGAHMPSSIAAHPGFHDQIAEGFRPFFGARVQPASGTSFSAPFLAAVVACLAQAVPESMPAQIKHSLLSSAVQYSRDFDFSFKNPSDQELAAIHEELRWKVLNPPQALETLQGLQKPRIKTLPLDP